MNRLAALLAAFAFALASCGRARPFPEAETPACERCHGGDGSAAPPRSVKGDTETTALGVGAHRAHVEAGPLAGAFACAECHVVPETVAGHLGDGPVVTFGALARTGLAGGATPGWTRSTATCSSVYCHGVTLSGGTLVAPVWTSVGAGQAACGACHGAPPPSHGAYGEAPCSACHGGTVLESGAVDVAGGKHVNGALDFSFDGGGGSGCATCHGAPPPSGAHLAHAAGVPPGELAYGDLRVFEDWTAPGDGYAFGCGHCHPLDPALHLVDAGGDGLPDLVLGPPAPPAAGDEVKARNASDAAFAGGTCSGVYCHSSGQATPAYAATPAWTAAPGAAGCGSCHGNPPRYDSGGAGAPDANSHVQLQADGWEWGHALGLPGPWHPGGAKHGLDGPADAAPITCQTCHFESVLGSGPGGFYWLDTTGSWQLPGGDPGRLGNPIHENLDCTRCHVPGGPATPGAGRSSPLRHVNGRRDVVFDPRTEVPDLAWLPAAPNLPSRPYWVTLGSTISIPPGGDLLQEGTTLSLHLANATYAPATKTCSNVACHLFETSETWGRPHGGSAACAACHGF